MQGYGRGKFTEIFESYIIIVCFMIIYLFVDLVNSYFVLFYHFNSEKYGYQAQEQAWDQYDEKWDPYAQQQHGQGYHDQYYG
jgi:hypothetical protein